MSYHPFPTVKKRTRHSHIVLKMLCNKRSPYLMEDKTPNKTAPWQWTGDRKKAMSWPTIKEAKRWIDGTFPGWRKDLKEIGRPVTWMRVMSIAKKAKYPELMRDGCCTFLGFDGTFDLYHHTRMSSLYGHARMNSHGVVSARWSAYASDYISEDVAHITKETLIDLRIARRLAVKRGLIIMSTKSPRQKT